MRSLLFASILLLTGCAGHHYDSDRNDPNYQHGRVVPLLNTPTQPIDANHSDPKYRPPVADPSSSAVTGLIATGVALAANRDYYKRVGLTGHCACRTRDENALEVPCGHVEVVILDADGHELGRTQSEDGAFAFPVRPHAQYRLKAFSAKYRMEPPVSGRLERGDDVVLHLIRAR